MQLVKAIFINPQPAACGNMVLSLYKAGLKKIKNL